MVILDYLCSTNWRWHCSYCLPHITFIIIYFIALARRPVVLTVSFFGGGQPVQWLHSVTHWDAVQNISKNKIQWFANDVKQCLIENDKDQYHMLKLEIGKYKLILKLMPATRFKNTFCFMMQQSFLVSDGSGMQGSHFSTRTLLLRSHAVVICAECTLALACWNKHGLLTKSWEAVWNIYKNKMQIVNVLAHIQSNTIQRTDEHWVSLVQKNYCPCLLIVLD